MTKIVFLHEGQSMGGAQTFFSPDFTSSHWILVLVFEAEWFTSYQLHLILSALSILRIWEGVFISPRNNFQEKEKNFRTSVGPLKWNAWMWSLYGNVKLTTEWREDFTQFDRHRRRSYHWYTGDVVQAEHTATKSNVVLHTSDPQLYQ